MSVTAVIQCTVSDLYDDFDQELYSVKILKEADFIDKIVLAVPKLNNYRVFDSVSADWGVDLYYGSDFDVCERIINAVKSSGPDVVVRTLLKRFYTDMDLVRRMVDLVREGCDYVTFGRDINYEVAADVFSYSALERAAELLADMGDDHTAHAYRFSPWRLIEDHEAFHVVEIDDIPDWPQDRVRSVKTKLASLTSHSENMSAIDVGNPSSRYQQVKKYLSDGARVLDIACGQGGGAVVLAEKAAEVLGIDYNQAYVDAANERFAGENVSYICGDDTKLEEYKSSFDTVVSLHTLEHLPDDQSFLRRVHASLVPGGRLIIEVPRLLPKPIGEPLLPFHEREYSDGEMRRLLTENGFEIVYTLGGDRGVYVPIEYAREVLFYVCVKGCSA